MENSKTRREAALLVFVVFLLGVLLGGLGNHLWGERVWGRQNPLGSPTRDQLVERSDARIYSSRPTSSSNWA